MHFQKDFCCFPSTDLYTEKLQRFKGGNITFRIMMSHLSPILLRRDEMSHNESAFLLKKKCLIRFFILLDKQLNNVIMATQMDRHHARVQSLVTNGSRLLTAAHCCEDNPSNIGVIVGENSAIASVTHEVEELFSHHM